MSSLLLLLLQVVAFHQDDPNARLRETFERLAKAYPADSASLHWFYFEWPSPRDVQKDIKHMEDLLSERTQKVYRAVETGLKPALSKITANKRASRESARNVVLLYSAYDKFQGEALCGRVLNARENYDLVWKTVEVLAVEAKKDTFFIASLISLAQSIRTNVELAEAMPGFVWRSIGNNPKGFLQMFARRSRSARSQWMSYWMSEEFPDQALREVFVRIARTTGPGGLSNAARQLLEEIDKRY